MVSNFGELEAFWGEMKRAGATSIHDCRNLTSLAMYTRRMVLSYTKGPFENVFLLERMRDWFPQKVLRREMRDGLREMLVTALYI